MGNQGPQYCAPVHYIHTQHFASLILTNAAMVMRYEFERCPLLGGQVVNIHSNSTRGPRNCVNVFECWL